jgi:hypothetical protein
MPEYYKFDGLIKNTLARPVPEDERLALEEIHAVFVTCAPSLPEIMKHDIAIFFEDFCTEFSGESITSLFASKLREILYLVEGEYERVDETFGEVEWGYIRDIFNDFALEIDQEMLTYVMRQVVSRGIFDGK